MADAWDNQLAFIKFYGIDYNDWGENFATFSNWHNLLVRDYISAACDCNDYSVVTDSTPFDFLYPYNIAKIYFIEGRIEGEITLAAGGATSTVTDYKISLYKVNQEDNESTLLYTTNWVSVNTTLLWDSDLGVGDEIVYHWWIETTQEKKLTENDRIFIRIEILGSNTLWFYHQNGGNYEDLWMQIPFRFG